MMLIDEHRHQVDKALHEVKGLSPEERHRIVVLDLSLYDSLVVAYLRHAHYLLSDDPHFDWKTREDAWHSWSDHVLVALSGSLRYRDNEALIVAVGVCAALFPIVHHGAGLMAYKVFDDVVLAAQ